MMRVSLALRVVRLMVAWIAILLVSVAAQGATHCKGNPQKSLHDYEPSSGLGIFDVEWCDDDELVVVLKVAFAFEEGHQHLAPGFDADEYRWDLEPERQFKQDFVKTVQDAWSGRHTLVQRRDGQPPRRVPVRVVVDTSCDPDEAHWLVTVRHYPEDAAVDLSASVCAPGSHHYADTCHDTVGTKRQGTVALASPHRIDEFLGTVGIGSLEIPFAKGEGKLGKDEADWLAYSPTIRLFTRQHWDSSDDDPYWSVRLFGFASATEVGGAIPGGERPAVPLIRKRLESVLEFLVTQSCGDKPTNECRDEVKGRVRFQTDPNVDDASVWVEVHRPRDFNTLSHEAGHMFGLGDEAHSDKANLGRPLVDAEYAALVSLLTPEDVVYHDGEGLMSRGGVVEARYYVTFLEALREASKESDWVIESGAAAASAKAAPSAKMPSGGTGQAETAPPPRQEPTDCVLSSRGRSDG